MCTLDGGKMLVSCVMEKLKSETDFYEVLRSEGPTSETTREVVANCFAESECIPSENPENPGDGNCFINFIGSGIPKVSDPK